MSKNYGKELKVDPKEKLKGEFNIKKSLFLRKMFIFELEFDYEK
jgi:hypothetical protein